MNELASNSALFSAVGKIEPKFGLLLKNKEGFLSAMSETLISASAKRHAPIANYAFSTRQWLFRSCCKFEQQGVTYACMIHESMRRLDVISPMYLVRSTETMIRRIRAPCYLVILVVRSVEKTHSPRHFPSLLHTVRVLLSVKDLSI